MAKLSVGKAMLQAKAHERRGELAEAQALYQAVISDYPGNRRAKDALGALKAPPKGLTRTDPSHEEIARVIAVGRNKSAAEAIAVATNLTRRFPASGVAANVLGGFLQSDGRPDEAEAAFRRAIELNPDLADAHYNLGKLCRTLDRMDEAEAAYRRAIRIRPRYMEARRNLGNVLLDMGRMEDAATAFREAIETDPRHGSSHHGLSRATRYSPDHPHLAEMLALSDCDGLDDDARADLGFAIARAYEQIGDLELAAKYLAHGNAARRRQLDYRFETDENLFKLLTDCAAELTGIVAHSPRADFTPVFILGMPRSGTTLVEQIVGSHSDVTPGGELEYLGQWLTGPTLRKQRISQGFVAQLRAHYLQTVGRLGGGTGMITDKMPQNFRWIPFIAAALPEAKIIHVHRDPRAVCWSNYKQNFSGSGLGYTCDLGDTVRYHGLYRKFMTDIRPRYMGRILDVDYERLTEDPENLIRRLIDHLGLPWQDACLNFHKNRRSVRTASQQQVRKKIYKGSSEEWRRFEPFLDGALDALKGPR